MFIKVGPHNAISIFFRYGLNPNGKLRKRNFETFNEPTFNKDSFSDMLDRMNKTHNRYVNMKKALIGMVIWVVKFSNGGCHKN